MGILGGFRELFIGVIHHVASSIRDVITEAVDIATKEVIDVSTDIRETFLEEAPKFTLKAGQSVKIPIGVINRIRKFFGFKPKPPSAKIRAALRAEYLALAPGEKEIAGVEWDDEVYTETPK